MWNSHTCLAAFENEKAAAEATSNNLIYIIDDKTLAPELLAGPRYIFQLYFIPPV